MLHNRTARRSSRRNRSRTQAAPAYLEALESRVLLSVIAFSWAMGVSGDFHDTSKWKIGGEVANEYPHNFGGNQYIAVFDNVGTVTVDVVQNDTLSGIRLVGNSRVRLNFHALNRFLTLENVSEAANGQLRFTQESGSTTSLILAVNNSGFDTGFLVADSTIVNGNSEGQSAITITNKTKLQVTHDVTNESYRLDLAIQNGGILTAENVWLGGKDESANGKSSANIDGNITVANYLRVGGHGAVDLTVTRSLNADRLIVHNESAMHVLGVNAHVLLTGSASIGFPTTAVGAIGGPAITIGPGKGAKLTIDDGARFDLYADTLRVVTGNGTLVEIKGGAKVSVPWMNISHGDVGGSGPVVRVSDERTTLHIGENLAVGNGYYYRMGDGRSVSYHVVDADEVLLASYYAIAPLNRATGVTVKSGSMEILDKAHVTVTGRTLVASFQYQAMQELSVKGSGPSVSGGTLTTGHFLAAVGTGDHANISISGPDALLETTDGAESRLGAGDAGVRFDVANGAKVKTSGSLRKNPKGVVTGNGLISVAGAPFVTAGTYGDIAPGGYFVLDADGQLSTDPISEQRFGTLTIDGNLDASAGFTLDSVLGSPGQSNLLAVTGTATLGGSYTGQLAIFTDPDINPVIDYAFGTTFTLMTAGSIAGGFTDQPFGGLVPFYDIHGKRQLPALASGLFWTLQNTGTQLRLVVDKIRDSDDPDPIPATHFWAEATTDTHIWVHYSPNVRPQIKRPGDLSFTESGFDIVGSVNTGQDSWFVLDKLFPGVDYQFRGRLLNSPTDEVIYTEISTIRLNAVYTKPEDFLATWDTINQRVVLSWDYDSVIPENYLPDIWMAYDSAPDAWVPATLTRLSSNQATIGNGECYYGNISFKARNKAWNDAVGDDSVSEFTSITTVLSEHGGLPAPSVELERGSGSTAYHVSITGVSATDVVELFWDGIYLVGHDPYLWTPSGLQVDIAYPWGDAVNANRYLEVRVQNHLSRIVPIQRTLQAVSIEPAAALSNGVFLKWDNASPNETGFKIMRRRYVDLGTWTEWTQIGEVDSDVLSYLDSSLQPGAKYSYRIVPTQDESVAYYNSSAQTVDASDWSYGVTLAGSSYVQDGKRVYIAYLVPNDRDVAASLRLSLDWGDGILQSLDGVPTGPLSHIYADDNSYTPTISVAAPIRLGAEERMVIDTSPLGNGYVHYSDSAFIGAGSVLDLTNGNIVLQTGDATCDAYYAQVKSWLHSAFYGPARFTGPGITSSAAAAEGSYIHGLGAVLNRNPDGSPLVSSFHGIAVDANAILIAYTYAGDGTLDGTVNAFDLNQLAAHWQQPANAGWYHGDFNYDGAVDAFDLNILANNWQATGMTLLEALAAYVAAHPPIIGDGSFESYLFEEYYDNDLHEWVFPTWLSQPQGGAWSFTGNAGVLTLEDTCWGLDPDAAADGYQAVYLAYDDTVTSAISQSVNFGLGGTFILSFLAAQQYSYTLHESSVAVRIDGNLIGTYLPGSSLFSAFTTGSFTVGMGHHTLSFEFIGDPEYLSPIFLDAITLDVA